LVVADGLTVTLPVADWAPLNGAPPLAVQPVAPAELVQLSVLDAPGAIVMGEAVRVTVGVGVGAGVGVGLGLGVGVPPELPPPPSPQPARSKTIARAACNRARRSRCR
jgi:hypothetical protein